MIHENEGEREREREREQVIHENEGERCLFLKYSLSLSFGFCDVVWE